ncbi:hypothetical protein BC941DRAFT_410789 [Chlamydoabsidia padenii]|nr:hypothetical protein BC941DRAFT_410789 [Chlamydoabsidia padenii]
MGDAMCMLMIPPTQYEEPSHERSHSLHRSFPGLRRFSRSLSGGPTTNVTSQRRSTMNNLAPTTNNTVHVRIVPSIENPSRSLIFDIFDRDLAPSVIIKIGRFIDRTPSATQISFKTKVVSRSHCELWVENGKLFIRDTKSSSGTFLNHTRICPPNQESQAHEIKDGDIVQLGVDYQGGVEEIYRSVKMRFEVNKTRRARSTSFNMSAFQYIRRLTQEQQQQSCSVNSCFSTGLTTSSSTSSSSSISSSSNQLTTQPNKNNINNNNNSSSLLSSPTPGEIEECCICLYALAPQQGLFVSPCAHTYHFKCIRPLLQCYPGFQCPICRTYSDLDAEVSTTCESPTHSSSLDSSPLPDHMNNNTSNTGASHPQPPSSHPVNEDDDMVPLADLPTWDPSNEPVSPQVSTRDHPNTDQPLPDIEHSGGGFVGKLKLAWYEKRGKKRPSRSNFLRRHEDDPTTSSGFTGYTISRQSSNHLAEIEEQDE